MKGVLQARAVAAAETDSKLAPLLIPPVCGSFSLALGHSPVYILAGVEPDERFVEWHRDSLHLQVSGLMLTALERLDAPAPLNQAAFSLVLAVLFQASDRPLAGLAVFLVKMLNLLGLLGEEDKCAICSKDIGGGMAAASPDLQMFICQGCYNRVYGKQEVSVLFVNAKHLRLLQELASNEMEQCLDMQLDSEAVAFILSLAEERLRDSLPLVASALAPLAMRLS